MVTDETSGEREVEDDSQRKQVRVVGPLREYLKTLTAGTGKTYSEQIEEWLPAEDTQEAFDFSGRDVKLLKVTPAVHAQILDMAGGRVDAGEVVAYYGLLHALREGNYETAADLAPEVPELLLDAMEVDDV